MATFQVFISNEQQQQQDVKCAMPCALCIAARPSYAVHETQLTRNAKEQQQSWMKKKKEKKKTERKLYKIVYTHSNMQPAAVGRLEW